MRYVNLRAAADCVLMCSLLLPAGLGGARAATGSAADASADQAVEGAGSEDYDKLEAVLETSHGQIVIQFFAKQAPRHVEYFLAQARVGTYDGTTFHRLFPNGLIQGGDPLTKKTGARARVQYGTGGLNAGIPDEVNENKHITGAVSAALAQDRANPNEVTPGSSGSQFFIVISPQPQLDSGFTVFGKVVDGLSVAEDISRQPKDSSNLAVDRIEIERVTIREKKPTVEEMKALAVTLDTSLGRIKIKLLSESAPDTVRAFVRYARSGLYDGTTFFRVSGNYYMEAGYLGEWPADSPNRKRFFSLWPIPVEKTEEKHTRGTVSMRQTPDGMTSWYFFVIAGENPSMDGRDVPIGRVIEGLDVVDKIADTDVSGDKPTGRIEIKRVIIE